MTGADIACAARAWIGTPYVHQASACGSGADCLGLVRGVWRALAGCEPGLIPPYSEDWAEAGEDECLWRGLDRLMVAKGTDCDAVGDVLLFRMKDTAIAKHCGIQCRVGSHASFVHGYFRHGVVETSLSEQWRRRLVARFSFPFIMKG